MAKEKACQECEKKENCLSKRGKRRILTFPANDSAMTVADQMKALIDSEAGRKTYQRRIGIVEPVFANIREQKKLNRFTLRGKVKADIQWLLFCMVHNIEKIANYGIKK